MFLDLANVTLVSVTSLNIEQSHLALLLSSEHIRFGAVKLISSIRPRQLDRGVEHIGIAPIDLLGYNRFVLGELHRHVATEFCLIVQSDGFIVNPYLWSDEFLRHDYIGAPWPERVEVVGGAEPWLNFAKNRVGNGGFSLRSRRLLQLSATISWDSLRFPILSEDIVICHYLYDYFVSRDMRFAPLELARRFACESVADDVRDLAQVFGFHGKHWLRRHFLAPAFATSRYAAALESLLMAG